ncbi:MAG: tyrosine-type recombinase/integrase [Beijerinckiaceae bacterium]
MSGGESRERRSMQGAAPFIALAAGAAYEEYIARCYLPEAAGSHRGLAQELSYLRRHILPAFGATPMSQISKAQILHWVRSMRLAGYRPGTVNRALNLFKATMSKAVEWEVVGMERNPARGVKNLPDHARKERFITPREASDLIAALRLSENQMLFPFVGFLLLTGARKSEAASMRWEDVRLESGAWTIPLSKSGKPRHVPLSQGAVRMMHDARVIIERSQLRRSVYVFPNPKTGKPFRDLFHGWDAARRRAGLQDVRLHDLRHSYASALVNSGRSIYEVQKLLGHADVRTTERYAHLSLNTLMQGAEIVQSHFGLDKDET